MALVAQEPKRDHLDGLELEARGRPGRFEHNADQARVEPFFPAGGAGRGIPTPRGGAMSVFGAKERRARRGETRRQDPGRSTRVSAPDGALYTLVNRLSGCLAASA